MNACYHNAWVYHLGETDPFSGVRQILRTPYLDLSKEAEASQPDAGAYCLWTDCDGRGFEALYCLGKGENGLQVWKNAGDSWIVDDDCENQHLNIPIQMMCQCLGC